MDIDEKITLKHLARNVHEDFDGVCERIRRREFPRDDGTRTASRRYKNLLSILLGDEIPEECRISICAELDEISIRFLAIQMTIDQRVSVKNLFSELVKLETGLRRSVERLADTDLNKAIEKIKGGPSKAPRKQNAATIMNEPSLLEKVGATHVFLIDLLDELGPIIKFFDYKYGLAKAGQPSLYARVFAVHALADLFERENVHDLKAVVGQVAESEGVETSGKHNALRYTGQFLEFVKQFYFVHLPDEVVGRGNEGFSDQVRRLASKRKKDLDLVQLMMGSVSVECTLEFMKRADAVK